MLLLALKTDWIRKHLPLIILHTLFLVIVVSNFPWGKYFYGWDGLYPELNFGLNIKRALSGAWQENYGLGTMGGHGFASTLVHTALTWIMSWVLPTSAIRSVFTFLCLYLGSIGIYFLFKLMLNIFINSDRYQSLLRYTKWFALLGSLFYIANLGTVQFFAVQLEAFIIHYACLPWLIWSLLKLLHEFNRKLFLLFILINFLASTQGFIPQLFISYLMIVGIILIGYWSETGYKRQELTKSLKIIFGIFAANAYWLLPFVYYFLNDRAIYLNSYNNFTSTQEFIYKSEKYGTLSNLALLKSFFWESYQLGDYVFKEYIVHFSKTSITLLGFGFWGVIVAGVVLSFKQIKSKYFRGFTLAFLILFSLLAVNVPPFSYFNKLLQLISPSFAQAFRIGFTKLGIGVIFFYSLFFVLGIFFILSVIDKKVKTIRNLSYFFGILIVLQVIYVLPLFTGNLLYKKLTLTVPPAYFELITYLNRAEYGRVAELPQQCPEGWYSNSWGYFGSGFVWYGLKNPLLSRSADVWSRGSENYYWEVSRALKSKDYPYLEKLVTKYDIKWILYDPNVLGCESWQSFNYDDNLINFLNNNNETFTLVKTFKGNGIKDILLFKVNDNLSEVSIASNVVAISPAYEWSDQDQAYQSYGTYINSTDTPSSGQHVFYPFRSLFSGREQNDLEYNAFLSGEDLVFETTMGIGLRNNYLNIPNNIDTNKEIISNIYVEKIEGKSNLVIRLITPEIYLDGKKVFQQSRQDYTYVLDRLPTYLKVNGERVERIPSRGVYVYLKLDNLNEIILYDNNLKQIEQINELTIPDISNQSPPIFIKGDEHKISIVFKDFVSYVDYDSNRNAFSKITPRFENKIDQKNEDNRKFFRLTSDDSQFTLSMNTLWNKYAYIFFIDSRHITGDRAQIEILNGEQKTSYLKVGLTSNNDWQTNKLILAPMAVDGLGLNVVISNNFYGLNESRNDVGRIVIGKLPYDFIKNIKLVSGENTILDQSMLLTVDKKYLCLYKVKLNGFPTLQAGQVSSASPLLEDNNSVLTLSQAYHEGWIALTTNNKQLITFPHVKVNNWANGWLLDNDKQGTIYIFFWPQVLEYLGFVLLLGVGVAMSLKGRTKPVFR